MESASGSNTNRPSTRGASGDAAHSGAPAQALTGASPSSASAVRPATRGAETNTQLPPLPYGASADLKKVQASLDRVQGAGHKREGVDGPGSEWDNYTYNAERVLGSGAFGIVYQARIVETGDTVAIKKVLQDARFKNRELEIMQELKHPNIVELKHAFHVPGDKPRENYLNVVMEFCPETVHGIMKHHTKTRQLVPHILVQLYTYHMLRGVAYMHAMNICHRDIKPPNLLVNNETHELKICDFGSAKRLSKGEPNVAYICSRYYRAPELIFGATTYSTLIDMWSVACVTAELILQQVLFPGDSGVDQLMEIIKVLGTPTRDDLESMNPVYGEFKFPQIKSYPWNKIFRSRTSPEAVDWLSRVLQYNPKARPTGLQACMHPLFDDLRNSNTRLPVTQRPLPDSMFWFSDEELDLMDEAMKQKLVPKWLAFQQGGKWPRDLGSPRRDPGPSEQSRMSLPSVDTRHVESLLPSLEEKRPNTTGHSARHRDIDRGGNAPAAAHAAARAAAAAAGDDFDIDDMPPHRPDPLAALQNSGSAAQEKKNGARESARESAREDPESRSPRPAGERSPRPGDNHAPGHSAPPGSPPGSPPPEIMPSERPAKSERERKDEKRERRKKKKEQKAEREAAEEAAGAEARPATSDVGTEGERASPRQKKSKRHRKRDGEGDEVQAPTYQEADVVNFAGVNGATASAVSDERVRRLSTGGGRGSTSMPMPMPEDVPSPAPPEENLAPLSSRRSHRGSNELPEPPAGQPPRSSDRSGGHGRRHRSFGEESASGSQAPSGAQPRSSTGARSSRSQIDSDSLPPAL